MLLLRTAVAKRAAVEDDRRPWSHVRAGAAVVVLLAATVYLAGHDGGRPVRTSLPVVALALVASPLLVAELTRLRRRTVLVIAGVAAGPVLAWAFAPYRSGAARTLLVAVLAMLVFLAARHLWRRPWGPAVLGAVVAVAVGRAWLDAFFAWWGAGMGGGTPTWLALSWHNQSGTLMGVGAVAALAVGAVGPARARPPALVLAGATAAGAWLSGSRGAVLATAVGIAVVLVAARRHGLRHLAATVAVTAVLALGTTVGLMALTPGADGQPLTTREQAADQNLRARVGHAEAAARMAMAHPVTGTGPGSYRWASRTVYGDDVNLTASAHNEYLEALGETGLLGGLPVAVAAIALAGLVLRVVRDRDDGHAGRDDVPQADPDGDAWHVDAGRVDTVWRAGVLAAAGAVATLGLHAGADFDWDYPLLAALLAVGAGVLHAALRDTDRRPAGRDPRWGRAVAGGLALAGATAAALAVGVASTGSSPAPWDLEAGLADAAAALAEGDAVAADRAIDGVERWNRGSTSLPVLRTLAGLTAGDVPAADVVTAVDARTTPTRDQLLAVELLRRDGATTEATSLLDALADVLDDRRRWGVREAVGAVAVEHLRIGHDAGGCRAAEGRLADLSGWLGAHEVPPAAVAGAAALPCRLGDAGHRAGITRDDG